MQAAAGLAENFAELRSYAARPLGTTREQIYLSVASIYRTQAAHLTVGERALIHDILSTLSRNVDIAIRVQLAEGLANDAAAPHGLIVLLANDVARVARPVILRSAVLTDADALELIARAGVPHQEAVAERQNIGERVSEALTSCQALSVQLALLSNSTASLSLAAFEALARKADHSDAIRARLALRSDLPPQFAANLRQFVPDIAHAEGSGNSPETSGNKLIEKMAASGQLKASFLLRVLKQGQIDLFDAGLAKLLGLNLSDLRNRFYRGGPIQVALACRAVGIDRCVFQTIYSNSRQAHGMRQTLHSGDMAEVEAAFLNSKPAALALLQAA